MTAINEPNPFTHVGVNAAPTCRHVKRTIGKTSTIEEKGKSVLRTKALLHTLLTEWVSTKVRYLTQRREDHGADSIEQNIYKGLLYSFRPSIKSRKNKRGVLQIETVSVTT